MGDGIATKAGAATVATLYEYWIFIMLHQQQANRRMLKPWASVAEDADAFIKEEKGSSSLWPQAR